MKRFKSVIMSMLVVIAVFMMSMSVFAAEGEINTPNYEAAKALYGISLDCIEVIPSGSTEKEINATAKTIGKLATASKPYMLYIPAGTYNIGNYISVPANVVLVAEDNTVFVASAKNTKMALVSGSVYGGTWNANKKVNTGIWLNYTKFSGKNGEVRNTSIKNTLVDGIHYGSFSFNIPLGGAKAIGNTITNSYVNGITAVNGGSFAEISNNTIKNVGHDKTGSGLSITLANVNKIIDNTIVSPKGHGISTDTDPASDPKNKGKLLQKTVTINLIKGNTIKKAGTHGIYLDVKVVIKKVQKNTITGCKLCGINIDDYAKLNLLDSNVIKSNKATNVNVKGKKSSLIIGSNNTIQKSGAMGLMVENGAKCTIKGTKNVITKNKTDIRVWKSQKSKLTIKNKKKNTFKPVVYN